MFRICSYTISSHRSRAHAVVAVTQHHPTRAPVSENHTANSAHSVCIVSILRLHTLVAISNSTDQSYDNPAAATWSSIEVNVGIICSCLPLLRPLIQMVMVSLMPTINVLP